MDNPKENLPQTQQEVQLLEQDIEKLEQKLRETYCEAGITIMEAAELQIRRINSLVDKIIVQRKQLAQMRGQKPCEACGAYNDSTNRYCKRCGATLCSEREEQI